jgi:clan AA aspartic protease
MNGTVVGTQPRIGVTFKLAPQPDVQIEFVIDTGFEGTLTLPPPAVAAMGLPFYQRIRANLADGSVRMVDVHKATIRWHSRELDVAVLAMGTRPLLGTSLLEGSDLMVHFEDGGALSLVPF